MSSWPQIIILLWMGIGMGAAIATHRKISGRKNNFWISLVIVALNFFVLDKGGFWDVFKGGE